MSVLVKNIIFVESFDLLVTDSLRTAMTMRTAHVLLYCLENQLCLYLFNFAIRGYIIWEIIILKIKYKSNTSVDVMQIRMDSHYNNNTKSRKQSH